MTRGDGRAGRVLAVDDKPEFVELLAEDLMAQHYEVETAVSGEECVAKAREFQPEVILLDVQMPGLDGFQTCFRLKADPSTEHIPVIFLTGHNAEEGSAMAAVAAGGSDFLAKPYSSAILFSRVAAQIASARRIAKLRECAMRDMATGTCTLAALREGLRREFARVERTGPVSVALVGARLDVEPGTWGHTERLRELSEALFKLAGPPDMVARTGGSEMTLFVVGLRRDHVMSLADQMPEAARVGVVAPGPYDAEAVETRGGPDALADELIAELHSRVDRATKGEARIVMG